MTDIEFQELVQQVKDAFLHQKRRVMPHYKLPDNDEVFKKATTFMLQHCNDAEMFVVAQFYHKSINDKMAMLPQFLYTAEAVENFGRLLDTISSIVPYELIYKENKNRLNAHTASGFSEEEVLTSMTLNFDACFRLTYSKQPISKLMNNTKLRERAKKEFSKEVEEVLKKYNHDTRRITAAIKQ